MQNKITAAILAGGPASRFSGVVKSNLVIGGETIIARSISVLKELFCEIIIVTNTPGEFTGYSEFKMVRDQYAGIGPLGAIHAALHAASFDAVFVFAGDMPLLSQTLIEEQIKFFEKNSCDILVPERGKSIEPLHSIYRKSVLNRLDDYLSVENNNAVREFFRSVDTKYMELDDTDIIRNIFSNVNQPSDIQVIERIIKGETL
jgi:molybdopterin-guanine dinucleotide biosynthesis protein A